ncbi:hypothetical protein TI05_03770 [Achromatium sp. WMS3]|nr:hypothetical protein TI05_03770 [Achromatium sp. WMS3]
MKGLELTINLKEDCVFSNRSATVGGHKGLNYIPGSALLGAVAAKLYPQLSKADAFTVFHSGKIRFGNGLPIAATGEIAWPMPMCWHQLKEQQIEQDGQLLAERIWYGNNIPNHNYRQLQQIRTGYVTASGKLVKPHQKIHIKTAIDPEYGVARETNIFGYQTLTAQQRFVSHITATAAVSDALWYKVQQIFTEPLLLGRSRSAEYGLANSTLRELKDPFLIPNSLDNLNSVTDSTPSDTKQIVLWLLSDLVVLDAYGQPTLTPRPEWMGLPKGQLNLEQSYVSTRRYSPWNAYRNSHDIERQALSQGSILTFDLA